MIPKASPGGSVVRLTLIGPDGAFVTNTRPQGGTTSANFGLVDVAHPQGGTWTAVLYTPTAAAAVAGQPQPFTGNVILDASTQKDVPDGSVSPSSLTLGPGQTGHVRLSTHIDGTQGDTAESVTVAAGSQQSSVPVVLRPVIPISGGKGTFSGTITGGNARAVAPTQTNTYSFNVPKGRKDLNVGVHLNTDPNVLIEGALIDPDGETVDVDSNATAVDTTTGVITSGPNLQLVQSAPESGQWRFVLIVVDPVSGAEVVADVLRHDRLQRGQGVVEPAGQHRHHAGRGPGQQLHHQLHQPGLGARAGAGRPPAEGQHERGAGLAVRDEHGNAAAERDQHLQRPVLPGAPGHQPAHGGGHVEHPGSGGAGRPAQRAGRVR